MVLLDRRVSETTEFRGPVSSVVTTPLATTPVAASGRL